MNCPFPWFTVGRWRFCGLRKEFMANKAMHDFGLVGSLFQCNCLRLHAITRDCCWWPQLTSSKRLWLNINSLIVSMFHIQDCKRLRTTGSITSSCKRWSQLTNWTDERQSQRQWKTLVTMRKFYDWQKNLTSSPKFREAHVTIKMLFLWTYNGKRRRESSSFLWFNCGYTWSSE